MGSYINIGLISMTYKKDFIDKCIELIETLDEFNVVSIKYPKDKNYSAWVEVDRKDCTLERAMQYCYHYDMAEILCDFEFEHYYLENVLVRVKHIQEGGLSLLFEIPEENNIFRDIDVAEATIVSFFQKNEKLGFEYAFCDNEANTPIKLEQINHDEEYAIFVRYKPNIDVVFASWKIDGLSNRDI